VPFTGLGLVLETVQDPGNLGASFAPAAAAGATGLWLSRDSVDLDNQKVLRASVGTGYRWRLVRFESDCSSMSAGGNAGNLPSAVDLLGGVEVSQFNSAGK